MNKKTISFILFLIVISTAGIYHYKETKSQESSMPSFAFEEEAILITTPYAFATTPHAKTGAAFMSIENTSGKNDTLISVKSDVAEFTEIHENYIDPDDGVMIMRKINGIKIPKEGSVLLKPKGYHIMFINLKRPLKIGDSFPVTLVFSNSSEQIITIKTVAPGMNQHSHH